MKDVWSDDWPNCLHCRRVKINDEVGNVQKRCFNSNSGAFIHQTVTQFNFPARLHILAPPFLLSLPLLSPSPSFSPVLHHVHSTAQLEEWSGNLTVLFLLVHPQEIHKEWQVGVSYVDDTGWMGPIWVTTGGCVLCG